MKKEKSSFDLKCENCGSQLCFDPKTQKLCCEHCNSTKDFEIAAFSQKQNLDGIESKFSTWDNVTVLVQCQNCGGKEVVDVKNISKICPFCGGNEIVKSENETAGLKPDAIIPFQVDKSEVKSRFAKWISKRIMAPRALKKFAKINEFNPIYTPCWSFDADVSTVYNGILIYEERETVHNANGGTQTITVDVPKNVSGQRNDEFRDLIIQVGQKINQYNFNKIMPYEMNKLKVYDDKFLAGFMANHYSINCEESWKSAINIMKVEITDRIRVFHKADRVRTMNLNSAYSNKKYAYVLLPVWIGNYHYKTKDYNFYVNGNTGKVGGKTPISPFKVALVVLLTLGVIGLITYLVIKYGDDGDSMRALLNLFNIKI